MSYQTDRSLCWNIADAIGMPEREMRKAVNAEYHFKELVRYNKDEVYSRDFIVSKNGALVMISIMARKDYVDYMVTIAPLEMYSSVKEAIRDSSNWAAGNAVYFNSTQYKHMAKVHALVEVAELTGGAMHPVSSW